VLALVLRRAAFHREESKHAHLPFLPGPRSMSNSLVAESDDHGATCAHAQLAPRTAGLAAKDEARKPGPNSLGLRTYTTSAR
jgi:hypothetical protein